MSMSLQRCYLSWLDLSSKYLKFCQKEPLPTIVETKIPEVEVFVDEVGVLEVVEVFDIVELEDGTTFWKSSMAYPPPHNCLESPAHTMVHPVEDAPAPPAVFSVFPHQHSFPYCTPA